MISLLDATYETTLSYLVDDETYSRLFLHNLCLVSPHHSKQKALLLLRQLPVPLDLHRAWERGEAAVVGSHVLGNAPRSGKSLEVALWSWCPTKVIQPPDDLEHGSKTGFAEPKP